MGVLEDMSRDVHRMASDLERDGMKPDSAILLARGIVGLQQEIVWLKDRIYRLECERP